MRNHLVAKCNQPKKPEKLSENSAVTNVTNQNDIIGWKVENGENEEVKFVNTPPGTTIGKELVTLVTLVTGPQKWTPGLRVQVGHPTPAKRFVALNEQGTQRIGEDHAGAKLSDAQVEAIRDEYEAYPLGHELHIGYRLLAKRWGVSKSTIRNVCNYAQRNQWAGRWKRVIP